MASSLGAISSSLADAAASSPSGDGVIDLPIRLHTPRHSPWCQIKETATFKSDYVMKLKESVTCEKCDGQVHPTNPWVGCPICSPEQFRNEFEAEAFFLHSIYLKTVKEDIESDSGSDWNDDEFELDDAEKTQRKFLEELISSMPNRPPPIPPNEWLSCPESCTRKRCPSRTSGGRRTPRMYWL